MLYVRMLAYMWYNEEGAVQLTPAFTASRKEIPDAHLSYLIRTSCTISTLLV